MPLWTEDQFIARAKQLAKEHAASSAPLNDLVEKVARAETLNPDEIRTLGRLTNVAVFQEMFQGKTASAAPDRMIEFEPGDPEVVINRIVKAAAPAPCTCGSCAACGAKVASYLGDLPDLMRGVRAPGQELMQEKVAAAETEREAPAQLQIMRLRKLSDQLDVEVKIAAARWESTVDELVRRFKKAPGYGPSFVDFEKDAVASEGAAIRPELEVLREELRLPAASLSRDKVASLQARHVFEVSPELELIKRAAQERQGYQTLRQSRDEVVARLSRLRS